MNPPSFNVRRATLDDLPVLRPLWEAAQLDPLLLEKRLTDFQIAETAEGRLVGAVGLHVDGLHGRIHSECFLDAAQTDALRAVLWERLLAVARNRGLVRLWVLEAAPFCSERGFAEAGPDIRKKFPACFGDDKAAWHTLKLKDDITSALSMDQEFELFRQASQQDRQRMMRQGRIFKGVATGLAVVIFLAVVAGGVLLLKKNRLRLPFSSSTPVQRR